MDRSPPLPWTNIAKLIALSLPAVVIVVPTDLPPPSGIIGFMTGFLACLYGSYRWAFAAIAIAIAAAFLSMISAALSPFGATYGVAILLCLIAAGSWRRGGRPAMIFAAFGWVFLLFSPQADIFSQILLTLVFGLSGVWGIFAARQLAVSGVMAPKAEGQMAPSLVSVFVVSGGFLVTLALTEWFTISRPYWVPFIYLHVVATTGLLRKSPILRRMAGVLIGAAVAFALIAAGGPFILHILAAVGAFALSLRLLTTRPLISRALTTTAIVLIVFATDESALSSRLLAEVSAVIILLIVAAVLGFVTPRAPSSVSDTKTQT